MLFAIYRRSHNIGSILIRLFTWGSQWSHVGIWDTERNEVIEASALHGVVATPFDEFIAAGSKWQAVTIDCPNVDAAIEWARTQVGKGYDWGAIFGIVAREDWQDKDKWFCFELLEAALIAGGRQRFRGEIGRITGNLSYLTR